MEKSHVMKSPWHLWAVGAVALLWNVAGAYSILLAQTGRLPNPEPDELAYYAEHFETVEVNSSFYRMTEPAMSAAWLRRTPESSGRASTPLPFSGCR